MAAGMAHFILGGGAGLGSYQKITIPHSKSRGEKIMHRKPKVKLHKINVK